MAELKHRVFNPNTVGTGYSPLDQVCKYEEGEGWRLVQVIPHHTYESVAVFERKECAAAVALEEVTRVVIDETEHSTFGKPGYDCTMDHLHDVAVGARKVLG